MFVASLRHLKRGRLEESSRAALFCTAGALHCGKEIGRELWKRHLCDPLCKWSVAQWGSSGSACVTPCNRSFRKKSDLVEPEAKYNL